MRVRILLTRSQSDGFAWSYQRLSSISSNHSFCSFFSSTMTFYCLPSFSFLLFLNILLLFPSRLLLFLLQLLLLPHLLSSIYPCLNYCHLYLPCRFSILLLQFLSFASSFHRSFLERSPAPTVCLTSDYHCLSLVFLFLFLTHLLSFFSFSPSLPCPSPHFLHPHPPLSRLTPFTSTQL